MKDSFYFQHDYNARNDERLLQIRAEHGLAGYALYFMLLESMAESSDGYLSMDGTAGLSLSYGSAIEQLKALISRCIELGLFHEVKGRFSSKRMIEYKNFRKERAESGRRGANNRWGDSSAIAQPLAKSKTANTKDSIVKDRKGQNSIEKEMQNTKSGLRPRQVFQEASEELRLSTLLLDNILAFNPRLRLPDLQKWSAEVDKMLRIDKRSVEEIETLIMWVSQDSFWKANILSTAKLREKFDQLWSKASAMQQAKKPTYSIIS